MIVGDRMARKRFIKGYHTIRDTEENISYDFRVDIICDLLNELQQEVEDAEHYHSEVLQLYKAVSEKNEVLKKEILWWKYRCGEDISGDV